MKGLKLEENSDNEYTMEDIYNKIEFNNSQIELAGTEDLGRIVRSVADTFINLLNTFKTVSLKFYKDVKRGELKRYKESHNFTVNKALNLPYTKVVNLSMPIPRGMISSYIDYTNVLDTGITKMKMMETSSSYVSNIKLIHDECLVEEPNLSKQIQNAFNSYDKRLISSIERDMKKIDNPNNRTLEKPFGDLFKSMYEFSTLYNKLLQMESKYDEIPKVTKELDSIEQYLKNLTTNEDVLNNVTKKDIRGISDITYNYAKTFDMYGMLVYNLQRIEHNFVECLKAIILKEKL
jgi:hypothetical protein